MVWHFITRENPLLYWPLSTVFLANVCFHFYFTIGHLRNIITTIRVVYLKGTPLAMSVPVPGTIEKANEPHVTIVICSYNEGTVLPQTLQRACAVEWPRDKLTIHVCDDSTDKESIALREEAVAYWKKQGMDVERLLRPDRVGYKAGCLFYNFPYLKGEYVAYFDADHWPETDFLRNLMPYFFNAKGETMPRVGLVQAPWCFHNTHQSLLAECSKFTFDRANSRSITHDSNVISNCIRLTNLFCFLQTLWFSTPTMLSNKLVDLPISASSDTMAQGAFGARIVSVKPVVSLGKR
jgi:cellulose synthase/poly-beta-1,6-N-acetylglucosamine synthase-like glycosyltransferase